MQDVTSNRFAEAAVRLAQRQAERANEAKNEFLSRMSHELRTPLNAVLVFAQLLELDPLTDSQHSAVHHVLVGGRHLVKMIDDILDISRIENDKFELTAERLLVASLLADIIGLMRPLAAAARVEIRCDESNPQLGQYLFADGRRLRQVLLNLLSTPSNTTNQTDGSS